MVSKCALCGGSGNDCTMRSFPANSKAKLQEMWVDRLNLLEEEKERLLSSYREGMAKNTTTRYRWCHLHFEGSRADPTDVRNIPPLNIFYAFPTALQRRLLPIVPPPREGSPPARSTSPAGLPLLTKRMSEVRVGEEEGDPTPHVSRASSGSIPPLSRTPTVSSVPDRQASQRSDTTFTMEDADLHGPSSQETVDDSTDDYIVPVLPDYLLVSSSCLIQLFGRCPTCGMKAISKMTSDLTGSALVLNWQCLHCPAPQSWSSQPRLGGYYEGNVKLAAAAHTTALPLSRMADFGSVMGLPLPADRTFFNLLSKIVLPAVDQVFKEHMRRVHEIVRNAMEQEGLHISLDGRYSHCGFSAANCTVSFIDLLTGYIMLALNLHKNMEGIDGVSGRMEKEGVKEGLKRLLAMQHKIRSVCSDNDSKIGKMLREHPRFKDIKHFLDFWHLAKGLTRDLRELSKQKSCPNVQFWKRQLVTHLYYVHKKYAKSRELAVQYWLSVLPHVTGRHKHFQKIPFLNGISKCNHRALGNSTEHVIERDSHEFQQLKAVVMKPNLLTGLLRASPKANTSPNENFNSVINMYIPKTKACSEQWYDERVKLPVLHYNTLVELNMLNLREERGNSSVKVIGRESKAVKRKMAKVDHEWRNEVWDSIPGVIEERKWEQYWQRIGAPSDREYILALQQEEEGEIEEGEEGDGGESDVSEELGEDDHRPLREEVVLSDATDEESSEEEGEEMEGVEGEEDETSLSSGSEWDEGEAGKIALQGGGRGRGRGGSRGGRGRGGSVRGDDDSKEKKGRKVKTVRKKEGEDGEDSNEEFAPPSKRGKGQGMG